MKACTLKTKDGVFDCQQAGTDRCRACPYSETLLGRTHLEVALSAGQAISCLGTRPIRGTSDPDFDFETLLEVRRRLGFKD